MGAPRKYDVETRAKAVRLYEDRLKEHGESKLAARRHVGELLGINQATLRNWVEDRYSATPRVTDSAESAGSELAALLRENAELRRANEILKTVSAFSRRRRSTADFVDCRLHRRSQVQVRLSIRSAGYSPSTRQIAPSTYYAHQQRGPVSAAELADVYDVYQEFCRNRGVCPDFYHGIGHRRAALS